MKKKYIYSMLFVGILLFSLLAMGTGYGVYVATKDKEILNSKTLECFKIYYSDTDSIYKTNIKAVTNEDGITTSPLTLTITNICSDSKELQLRLNILDDTTVDTNAMIITASGNIEQKEIPYKNLTNVKTTMENVKISKLIGLINMEPGETVRTNIKYWFDEKKGITIPSDAILSAKFELIDTASSIKNTFGEMLIGKSNDNQTIDYSTPSTSEEGLIKTTDNDGDTYIYRGSVTNNYVSFAGYTWRIVRVNADTSVKLILDKSISYANYSEYYNSIDYTGMQYIYNNDTIDNNINSYLSNWYSLNIIGRGYDKYVATTNFCNDTNNTVSNYHTYFAGYERLINERKPTLTCSQTTADFGGTYNQKMGLISADEVSFAGGVYQSPNYSYYLNNGEDFYTSTPAEFYNYRAYMISVNQSGAIDEVTTNGNIGIRPVLSLNSTTTVSGTGTVDDPYTIDEE